MSTTHLIEISCREQTNTVKFPCEPCVEKQGAPLERKKIHIYRKNTELEIEIPVRPQANCFCKFLKAVFGSKHTAPNMLLNMLLYYISEAPDGCSRQQVSMHYDI